MSHDVSGGDDYGDGNDNCDDGGDDFCYMVVAICDGVMMIVTIGSSIIYLFIYYFIYLFVYLFYLFNLFIYSLF